jgi:hypothetical protein
MRENISLATISACLMYLALEYAPRPRLRALKNTIPCGAIQVGVVISLAILSWGICLGIVFFIIWCFS